MPLSDLVCSNRSCRRFDERHTVSPVYLKEPADLARHPASAAKRQLLNDKLTTAAETIVIDPVDPTGDIRYYLDGNDVHHVQKSALADVILKRNEMNPSR